jgi:hypothetical protein
MSDLALAYSIPAEVNREIRGWQQRFLIIGAVAAAACLIGAFFTPFQFFRSYLWAYMFFIGLALGSMALNMLQFLSGGAWGIVIRRICEAAMRTLPLLALLFVPIALGIPYLYEWANSNLASADEIMRHKHVYLNVPFFLIRAVIYFAGWIIFSQMLDKWSRREDDAGGRQIRRRLQLLSGPGLVFWGFSVTFMAVDWILSIEPHWFSTIFGLLFLAGQGLNGLAFVITVTVILARRRPFNEVITPRHLHDLGKLMLALVMIWAYFSFSQFLIIWSGNTADEIPWYVERLNGGWQFVGLALVFGHFALPFALLLSREIKRSAQLLTGVAAAILFMRLVDLYWLVMPDYRKGAFAITWLDFAAPVALGGIWLWYFTMQLNKRPLLPIRDPHLEEALQHGR